MVEFQLPKLAVRVRSPLPAPNEMRPKGFKIQYAQKAPGENRIMNAASRFDSGEGNIYQSEEIIMFEDKTLVCKDCGQEFVFTAGEQEFYAEKGFQNEPMRCKECRVAKKQALRENREMHTTVCAACGKEAKVPFIPKNDRPIYCSECFANHQ